MNVSCCYKGLMILLLCSVMEPIFGAELYRKQTGTVSLTGTTTSVSIEPVCMNRSFMVFSMTIDNAGPSNALVGGEIANATTLNFERDGSTGTVTIKWQVFEFTNGVTVQHGSTTNVGSSTDVGITSVDLTKSFVIATGRNDGSQVGSDDSFTANLTTATNLQLACPGNNYTEVFWQVIQYDDAIVKKVTGSIAGGSTSGTSTISPAVTNLGKTMVISNHTIGGNVNADDLPRTELTNATTVTYTRVGNSSAMNFVTYVVEFTDQTTVTRGTQSFASTVTSQNASISASTTTSGIISPGNQARQGSTSFASDDNAGHVWFTYEITSSSNLLIERATGTTGGNSTAQAPWQIVTFSNRGTTYYSFASGAWESNSSWSLSSDGSSGAVAAGDFPGMLDNVVIRSGHNITINNVADNGYCGISPNNLNRSNVGTFTGSGDAMFYHIGDIIISNGGTLTSTEELMLEGYTHLEAGGTLNVNEDIVNLGYLEVSAATTFSNTDDLILSGNSTTIINNTTTGFDDIYIDHTNATLCGDGVINIGNGSPDPTIQYFNSASLNQVCSSFTVTCSVNCPGGFPMTGTGNFSVGITGPGGVATTNGSSELEYWIDANSGVTGSAPITAWSDLSGNGVTNTVNGNPQLTSSALNGRSVITFDGTGDYLQTNLNINAGTRPDLSVISVYVPISVNTAGSVWGESNGDFDRALTAANGLGGCTNATTTGTACVNNATLFPTGNSVITSVVFDEDVASGSRAYTNGTSVLTFTSNHAPGNGSNTMQVGDTGVGGFIPYTGDIAEIIVLSNVVNNAKRIIIENYLDAKYHNDAAPAFVNDVYTMDNSANGDYDFEVAGIGQAADGSYHKDARGTGVVRMWNPKGLANSEFLMWGHDNTVLNSSTTAVGTAVDGTVIQERLSRIWRVSEVGDVGSVSISFDFSGVGGSPLGSNLRLLIDRDGDGFADNDVTPVVGAVSNGVATFSNVDFQNGDRFTLGNTDASSPLPIELIEFTAKSIGTKVLLEWATASELNNDFFTVERSTNAEEWLAVSKLPGAGTSVKMNQYSSIDDQPIEGSSYYRIKQTDYNGSVSYSEIRPIVLNNIYPVSVFPNPSKGLFTIGGLQETESWEVRVFNNLGQRINVRVERVNDSLLADLTAYPPGIYIMRIVSTQFVQSIRLVNQE